MNRQQRRNQARKVEATKADLREMKTKLDRVMAAKLGWTDLQDANNDRFQREFAARMQAKQSLERNGITAEDLEKNYQLGYEAGKKFGQDGTVIVMMASLCLSLHELYGFGQNRCYKVLKDVMDRVLYTMDTAEAVQDVYDKIGLRIDMDDPIKPVKQREDAQ